MAHYPADTFQEATEIAIEASNQLHGVINGDANAEVTVEDGSKIPSVRKAMVDSLYFKPPIAWAQGAYEDTYNQLREFVDGDVRTWWFAKGATVSTPVLMSTNPATDVNWTLWSAVTLNAATYETQKRLAAEAGLNMVGSFLLGGTVTNVGDVVFYETDGKYYGWAGAFPKVVAAGATPATSGGIGAGAWVDRTDVTLRNDLSASGGAGLVTGFNFVCAEAYTGSSDTIIIQSAINDALSKGIKYIVFNRDYVVDALTNRQEVIFVGTHKITGSGAYRLRIIDGTEQSDISDLGINAAAQLKRFASKSNPIVVIIGDSLTTHEPNAIDSQHTLYAALCRKIRADNPDKTITFYNRGIGGSTWYEIDNAAVINWPDWYTDPQAPWLDYVSALTPDLVVVSTGMNDAGSVNLNNISSVITKIKAFTSLPDVLCLTTPVPSTDAGGTYTVDFGSKSPQEGRDYNAGAVRSVCTYMGVPVIDVNRQCNALRDGFDILESSSIAVSSPSLVGGAYLSSVECRNWSATIRLNNAYAYTATPPLAVKVGPSSTDVALIKAAVSGNIKVELYNNNSGGVPYSTIEIQNQAIPSTSHLLRIEVYNQTIRVFIVGTAIDALPSPIKMKVGGGLYYPGIGNFESGYTTGFINSIFAYSYGKHKRIIPRLTNNELWGVGDGTANTKSPTGGNGINHPTALGAICLYQDLLNKSNFTIKTDEIITKTDEIITKTDVSTSYTLVSSDAGMCIEMNSGSVNTLTIPPNSSVEFPVGTSILVRQYGAGQTSIVAGSGVTIRNPHGTLKIHAQFGTVSLHKRGVDEWCIDGNLSEV